MAIALVRHEHARWTVNGYAPEPAGQPDDFEIQVHMDGSDRTSVSSYYRADEARELAAALIAAADAADAARGKPVAP